jgi:hypothetical protein
MPVTTRSHSTPSVETRYRTRSKECVEAASALLFMRQSTATQRPERAAARTARQLIRLQTFTLNQED